MLLAKSYESFLNMLYDRYGGDERIVCLLFVDPFNEDEMGRYITRRFEYLHERSGKYIDFFCAGYNHKDHMRRFNAKDYVEFINQLEELTTWRYYGGTSLLLLRYSDYNLQFDSVYDLNFTRMLIEGVIKDYRYFLEEIIFSLKKDIEEYLGAEHDKAQLKSIWKNFSELLPNFARRFVNQIIDTRKINKYFSPQDISRNL